MRKAAVITVAFSNFRVIPEKNYITLGREVQKNFRRIGEPKLGGCRGKMKTARRLTPRAVWEKTVSRTLKGQAGMPVLLDLHEDDHQGEEREGLDEYQAENHRRADCSCRSGIAGHAFASR